MPNLPTDELTADSSAEGQADSVLWLLNLIDELTSDVTPEQWAEIKAASEAARQEDSRSRQFGSQVGAQRTGLSGLLSRADRN